MTELLKDFKVIHRDITSLITVILNAVELTSWSFWNEMRSNLKHTEQLFPRHLPCYLLNLLRQVTNAISPFIGSYLIKHKRICHYTSMHCLDGLSRLCWWGCSNTEPGSSPHKAELRTAKETGTGKQFHLGIRSGPICKRNDPFLQNTSLIFC